MRPSKKNQTKTQINFQLLDLEIKKPNRVFALNKNEKLEEKLRDFTHEDAVHYLNGGTFDGVPNVVVEINLRIFCLILKKFTSPRLGTEEEAEKLYKIIVDSVKRLKKEDEQKTVLKHADSNMMKVYLERCMGEISFMKKDEKSKDDTLIKDLKKGALEKIEKIYNTRRSRHLFAYNQLLKTYNAFEDYSNVLFLCEEKQRDKLGSDDWTYSSYIRALFHVRGLVAAFKFYDIVYNSPGHMYHIAIINSIKTYVKAKDVTEQEIIKVDNILKELPGIVKLEDLRYLYKEVIKFYISKDLIQKAKQCFKLASDRGVILPQATYIVLIKSFSELGDRDNALDYYKLGLKIGHFENPIKYEHGVISVDLHFRGIRGGGSLFYGVYPIWETILDVLNEYIYDNSNKNTEYTQIKIICGIGSGKFIEKVKRYLLNNKKFIWIKDIVVNKDNPGALCLSVNWEAVKKNTPSLSKKEKKPDVLSPKMANKIDPKQESKSKDLEDVTPRVITKLGIVKKFGLDPKKLENKFAGFSWGESVPNNDCFFDAVAQGLQEKKALAEKYTVKSLRLLCSDFVKELEGKPENWVKCKLKGFYQDYAAIIQYTQQEMEDKKEAFFNGTALLGDYRINGQIIAQKLGCIFHIKEFKNNPEIESFSPVDIVINGQGEMDCKKIDKKDIDKVIHLVVYKDHFVRLKSKGDSKQDNSASIINPQSTFGKQKSYDQKDDSQRSEKNKTQGRVDASLKKNS